MVRVEIASGSFGKAEFAIEQLDQLALPDATVLKCAHY